LENQQKIEQKHLQTFLFFLRTISGRDDNKSSRPSCAGHPEGFHPQQQRRMRHQSGSPQDCFLGGQSCRWKNQICFQNRKQIDFSLIGHGNADTTNTTDITNTDMTNSNISIETSVTITTVTIRAP
jgi:hypothetical protein